MCCCTAMPRPPTLNPPTDVSRFEDLYQQNVAQVFAWARRYAGGRAGWAEDVTHDVFVRAWKHREELRNEDVRGWLFRVTQNRALSLLRREGSFVGRVRHAIHLAWHPEAPATPE